VIRCASCGKWCAPIDLFIFRYKPIPFALSKLFARRSKGGNEKQGLGSIVVVLRSDKDRLSTGAIEPAA
jgi:hypothetical protein